MKYGVLGTGMVGQALSKKLVNLGHEVCMGSRSADNAAAAAFAEEAGELGRAGTFADAAAFADVAMLAVKGEHALKVVEACEGHLDGKVLMDLTNPLDFSRGFPPRLFVCNDDSLGEQIQRAVPECKVVKTFNTLANSIMVDPGRLGEPTDVFVAGEDEGAKQTVSGILVEWGHAQPIDMGGIDASRGLEAWLLLWTRLYGKLGTPHFNLKLVRGE